MTRRWRKPLAVIAVVALAAMAAALLLRHDHGRGDPRVGQGVVRASSSDVTPRPDIRLAADEIATINALLASEPGFRDDVLFLVIATARDRCVPDDSGSLARMANRAQLPILSAVSQITAAHPALERPLYRYIQGAAGAVDCKRPFGLAGSAAIDLESYARRFPDSFRAPMGPDRVPSEYAGATLAQRAAEPCESVAYVVLPLGTPQWRCDAARSGVRRRIVSYCVSQRDGRGLRPNAELSAPFGKAIASGVAEIVGSIPSDCRSGL